MNMTLTLHQLPNNQDVEQHVVADVGLLLKRMETLRLEPDEVRPIEAHVFGDLAEACADCESKVRCEQDLYSGSAVEHDCESYCLNAATLSALAALPWFGKARTKADG